MSLPLRTLAAALSLTAASALAESPSPLAPLIAHVSSHRDGRVPASIDFPALDGDRSQLPIGVFDSGIGGLTVLEAILSLDAFHNDTLRPGPDGIPDFAGERFIYLGDQANMPYGNYPQKGREPYLRELILKDAIFLLGRRQHSRAGVTFDKPPVKAIVIACNTATAFGIDDIRAALRTWGLDVPVIGVVEAGARAVSQSLPGGGKSGAVAVLATVGTCDSGAYPRAIGRSGGLAGKSIPPFIQQGSIGLAGALEGAPAFIATGGTAHNPDYLGPAVANTAAPIDPTLLPAYGFEMSGILGDPARVESWQLNSITNYARYDITTLVEKYRRTTASVPGGSGGKADIPPPITTVVLGCTHFPIAQREISTAFTHLRDHRAPDGTQPYLSLIGEHLDFVNPAEFTARELFREIARNRLRATRDSREPPTMAHSYISIPNPSSRDAQLSPDGTLDTTYKYSRTPGHPEVEDTIPIPMADAPSVLKSLSGLSEAIPKVWTELTRVSRQ